MITKKALLVMLVLVNILNVGDVYTTYIFTDGFSDWKDEANGWIVANGLAGYHIQWFSWKILLYFTITLSIYLFAERYDFLRLSAFVAFLYTITSLFIVVIGNAAFILAGT